jgi:hypothetical protein
MTEEKKTKKEIEHKDRLGRALKLGDCVAVGHQNGLMIGTIKKLNPVMLKIVRVGSAYSRSSGYNKYPSECVLLDGPEVTMFLLSGKS